MENEQKNRGHSVPANGVPGQEKLSLDHLKARFNAQARSKGIKANTYDALSGAKERAQMGTAFIAKCHVHCPPAAPQMEIVPVTVCALRACGPVTGRTLETAIVSFLRDATLEGVLAVYLIGVPRATLNNAARCVAPLLWHQKMTAFEVRGNVALTFAQDVKHLPLDRSGYAAIAHGVAGVAPLLAVLGEPVDNDVVGFEQLVRLL